MKIWGAVSCCNLILWTFHQADEGLLQTGGNLPPVIGRMPERRDGALQGRCIGAADMQRIAEGEGLNTRFPPRVCSQHGPPRASAELPPIPGGDRLNTPLPAELFSQTGQVRPAYRPCR